jgi:hypothetical protein
VALELRQLHISADNEKHRYALYDEQLLRYTVDFFELYM